MHHMITEETVHGAFRIFKEGKLEDQRKMKKTIISFGMKGKKNQF